jgi:cytochrome c oxidase subunit 5a
VYIVCIVLQELKPTLDELGIQTPEELGYHQPELALPNPYNIH